MALKSLSSLMTVLWSKRSKKYLVKDLEKCLNKGSKKVP